MSQRQRYEMSEQQHKRLMYACQPTRYMVAGGKEPPSPADNAMRCWKHLGAEMGFDPETVMPPGPDEGERVFTAFPIVKKPLTNLGWANSWGGHGPNEPDIVKECNKLGHVVLETNLDPTNHGYDRLYYCELCGYKYHVDSSD